LAEEREDDRSKTCGQHVTSSVNRVYLPEVDHLRAFSALLVLSYHGLRLFGTQFVYGGDFMSQYWLHPSNPILLVIQEGHTGVSLFIVLSGFILSLGAVGNTVSYKPFLVARILRIYPMLVVCLLVGLHVSPSNLISFLTTLLPVNVPGGVTGSFTAMLWAVAIEFQCYLIFPFLIAFSNERGTRFLMQVIAVAFVFRLLAVLAEGANPRDISYWTFVGRIDQFCIGMIAARIYVRRNLDKIRAGWFLLSAAAVTVVLWQFNRFGGWPSISAWKIVWPPIEGMMWAFFIVTYMAAGRLLPYRVSWISAKLGEISYSMYLIHFAVVSAIIKKEFYVRPTGNGHYDALATTLLVALPIVIAIAILTYHTIELPFLRMRPKYIARSDKT
jgi:peptidoglycan/LPS O-acetylase OafA/YrhL